MISWDEILDRLKEVRDSEPEQYVERVKLTDGQFMSKKVSLQQAPGTAPMLSYSSALE